jgi:hypothetical protein
METQTLEMTAEFARIKDAIEFVDRYLSNGCSYESNVTRTGKLVRWNATVDCEPSASQRAYEYEVDLAENAGYVGNYGGKKAKLNGRTAPTSY